MRINVYEIIGDKCMTLKDGEIIYKKIKESLDKQQKMIIDYTNVKIFSSPFFNTAMGQLYGSYESDILNRYIEIKNLSSLGSSILKKVVENAKKYYKNKQAYEDIVKAELE